MINIIAAVSANGVIGKDGKLPWSLKEDMKRFKDLTMGNIVIMGANTYREIGKPLGGRFNIILSSKIRVCDDNVIVLPSLNQAIEYAKSLDDFEDIFICGGESVYKEAIAIADRIFLTRIDKNFDGDRFFPPIPDTFSIVSKRPIADGNLQTTFCEYINKRLQ